MCSEFDGKVREVWESGFITERITNETVLALYKYGEQIGKTTGEILQKLSIIYKKHKYKLSQIEYTGYTNLRNLLKRNVEMLNNYVSKAILHIQVTKSQM